VKPSKKPAPKPPPKTPFPWPRLDWKDAAILAAVVAVFSWICFRNIRQPGLYGDEAWSTIAAARFVWGSPPDPAAQHRIVVFGHALPMMINSYVGPVKSWIAASSFAIFGVSVPVIRATSGTVGLLGIVALYFLVRGEFGRLAAAAAALLAASDVSLALGLRCDWGPIDFAFFSRVASMLLLLTWRKHRDHLSLLLLASLLLGLGLSYKFDFLGTIAAIAVSFAVFYGRELRLRWKEAALAAGGFLLGSWPILLYNIVYPGATFRTGQEIAAGTKHLGIFEAVAQRFGILQQLLGGAIGEFFLGEHFQSDSLLKGLAEPAAMWIVPLLLAVPLLAGPLSGWRRPLGFFAGAFLLLLLALAAVPFVSGPHHLISLYPFPHLFFGAGLAGLWVAGNSLRSPMRWLPKAAAAAGFALLLTSNLALAQTFHRHLAARGGWRFWSESIYELSEVLQKDYADDVIELLDWGFEQPLIILAKDRLHLHAVYWQIQSDPGSEQWLSTLVRRPQRIFVRRAEPFAFDPVVHQRFDDALARSPDLRVEERKFYQKDGQLSFTILKIQPRS
jgi:4-amino-4-deoxy-L-arabinose transferase-like glycosyltransferase